MKKRFKIYLITSLVVGGIFAFALFSFAHSGKLDEGTWCHVCEIGCSEWGLEDGEYHCHYPEGYIEPKYSDGTLLKTDNDIYLIENGRRRLFLDADTFLTYGYNMQDIIEIDKEELNSYPMGLTIIMPDNISGSESISGSEQAETEAMVETKEDLTFAETIQQDAEKQLAMIPSKEALAQITGAEGEDITNRSTMNLILTITVVILAALIIGILTIRFRRKPKNPIPPSQEKWLP